MKKTYFLALFIVLCGTRSAAQIVANDDVTPPINPAYYAIHQILENDSLNGVPFIGFITTATVTQISSTNPGINLFQDRYVRVEQSVAPGTYYLTYQICEIDTPENCDTATVTVNVCFLDVPVVVEIIQPTCATDTGSFTLDGLPPGNWTIYMNSLVIPGSGSTYTFEDVEPSSGIYYNVVDENGCSSANLHTLILPANRFTIEFNQGMYVDLNTDGFITPGDLMYFDVLLNNTGACDLNTFSELSTNGGIVFPDNLSDLTISAGNSSQVTAYTVITQQSINDQGAEVWGVLSALSSNGGTVNSGAYGNLTLDLPDRLRLHAFLDTNGNGIQDSNETFPCGGEFEYEINDDGVPNFISHCGPVLLYEDNPGNTYTIQFNLPPYLALSESNSVYTNISVPDGSGITDLYFPITNVPSQQVRVCGYFLESPLPGNDTQISVTVSLYSDSAVSGTLNFVTDPAVTMVSVSPSGTLNANGFSADYTLQPYSSQTFIVTVHAPVLPNVQIGQLLSFSALATVPATDLNPADNTMVISAVVVASLDPNDNTESHGPQILHSGFGPDEYLNYLIRFENTGTANAINVRINDILDDQLDASTLHTLAASHDFVMNRTGTDVNWRFNNIQLPPSQEGTNIGKGFVSFEIKPKPGILVSDIIPNQASIFFDTNPAIITNTVETEFVAVMSVADHDAQALRIYPNPAQDLLNVSGSDIKSVQIIDVTVKVILTKNIDATQAEIGVSQLSNGIYFATITTNNSVKTMRFVKQ